MILFKPYTNQQYIDFIAWCNNNNCSYNDNGDSLESVEIIQEPPTIEEIKQQLINTVQNHMDTTARTRDYDSIASACSYYNSSVPKFKAEAEACTLWRDAVWSYCYAQLDLFEAGERDIPTDIIAELPEIEW